MQADEEDRFSYQDSHSSGRTGRSKASGIIIDVVVFSVLAAIAAYVYFTLTADDVILESSPSSLQNRPAASSAITDSVIVIADPDAKPLPLDEAEVVPSYGLPEEVPALNASDDLLLDQLRMFTSLKPVIAWSQASDLARRFVALVYNMAEGSLAHKYLPLVPLDERFTVIKNGGLRVDPKSYTRYDVYAKAFVAVDTVHLAATYRYFWPVFKKAFQELGEPKKSLHLEVLKAIDHVLEAPVIEGDVRLVQPSVYYHFADPALEKLSSVQKQMLRMGPKNSTLIKAKLEEIKGKIISED